MSLSEFNNDVRNHSNLPDKPTLDSKELKALFDKAAVEIKDYLNNILTKEIDKLLENKVNQAVGFNLISDEDLEKLNGIEDGATKVEISSGTNEPDENTTGEIYIQYFDE